MQFHDEDWKGQLRSLLEEIRATDVAAVVGSPFAIEKPIFFSAFIVRKLIEDTAVTDRLKSKSVSVDASPSARTRDELFMAAIAGPLEVGWAFDTTTRATHRISFHDLTSEIIHSDAFVWQADEGAQPTFLIASYQNVTRRLLWVPLDVYISMIEEVIGDAPKRWWTEKNLITGKITRHAD